MPLHNRLLGVTPASTEVWPTKNDLTQTTLVVE
jgi:hypothetical protein